MRKLIKRGLLLAAVITTTVLCCTSCGVAYAESIEEYEAQIQANNQQIEQLDIVKEQLHITAEALRSIEHINNGLDNTLGEKWMECNSRQAELQNTNIELQSKIDKVRLRQRSKAYIGNFTIAHYDPHSCCGTGTGKTATGTVATPGRTIAVDPRIIPLGSQIEINGAIYIAEDTGGAIRGNKIDMCVATHSEALQKGVLKNVPIYIIK